jgi:hypothetical protein
VRFGWLAGRSGIGEAYDQNRRNVGAVESQYMVSIYPMWVKSRRKVKER